MAGLFDTPQGVRALEAQQRVEQYLASPGQSVRGGLYNLGHALGGAAQRGIAGTDTRSAAQLNAAKMQEMLQGIDWSNPKTIIDAANKLNAAGNTPAAFELLQRMPKPTKPVKVDRSFQDMWNPETNQFEKHLFEDGTDKGMVGIDQPKDAKLNRWNFIGNVKLPDGTSTAGRFLPTEEGIAALEVRVGEEWVPAPAGAQMFSKQQIEEPPISTTPNKLEVAQVKKLTKDDAELGSMFSGLSKKDQGDFANRVASRARILRRDDKTLDASTAIDQAFEELKQEAITEGSFLGIPFGKEVKLPKALLGGKGPRFKIIK
jgi:hypothetical protein